MNSIYTMKNHKATLFLLFKVVKINQSISQFQVIISGIVDVRRQPEPYFILKLRKGNLNSIFIPKQNDHCICWYRSTTK